MDAESYSATSTLKTTFGWFLCEIICVLEGGQDGNALVLKTNERKL